VTSTLLISLIDMFGIGESTESFVQEEMSIAIEIMKSKFFMFFSFKMMM
jgi:hypothetical protein